MENEWQPVRIAPLADRVKCGESANPVEFMEFWPKWEGKIVRVRPCKWFSDPWHGETWYEVNPEDAGYRRNGGLRLICEHQILAD